MLWYVLILTQKTLTESRVYHCLLCVHMTRLQANYYWTTWVLPPLSVCFNPPRLFFGHLKIESQWRVSSYIGGSCVFEGALENASAEILQAYVKKDEYKPKVEHDLAMVVRCVFHRMHPMLYDMMLRDSTRLRGQRKQRAERIEHFWKVNLRSSHFVAMIIATKLAPPHCEILLFSTEHWHLWCTDFSIPTHCVWLGSSTFTLKYARRLLTLVGV